MDSDNRIFIKLLDSGMAEEVLKLQQKNKDLFERYSVNRNPAFYTVEGQLERMKKNEESQGETRIFGVFLTGSHELIGEVGLFKIERIHASSCLIGYVLDSRHNGKGYMTEAVQSAVRYAFDELKLHRIEAGVMPSNTGSLRVLEKCGFHKEGLAKQNVKINGKWEDHIILAIINEKETNQVN